MELAMLEGTSLLPEAQAKVLFSGFSDHLVSKTDVSTEVEEEAIFSKIYLTCFWQLRGQDAACCGLAK